MCDRRRGNKQVGRSATSCARDPSGKDGYFPVDGKRGNGIGNLLDGKQLGIAHSRQREQFRNGDNGNARFDP